MTERDKLMDTKEFAATLKTLLPTAEIEVQEIESGVTVVDIKPKSKEED